MRGWMCGVRARQRRACGRTTTAWRHRAWRTRRRSWDFAGWRSSAARDRRAVGARGARRRTATRLRMRTRRRDQVVAARPDRRLVQGVPRGHVRRRAATTAARRYTCTPRRRRSWRTSTPRSRRLGFDLAVEPGDEYAFKRVVVKGALPEQFRLLHTIDPGERGKYRAVRRSAGRIAGRHAGGVDRAARPDDAPLRHHDRHRRLHRERRRLAQLLRPPHPQVPRHERGPRLREADHRQGQRARGACAPSSPSRRGRASTSRWARTPTRTSGSRAATS